MVTMPFEALAILRGFVILFLTFFRKEVNTMLTMLLSMLSDENDRKALSELYKQYQGKTGRDSHRNVERL